MLHLTIMSLWISARFCHLTCPNDSRDSEWNKSLSTILHTFECYKGLWDIKTDLGLDHLQWCSVFDPAKRFLESKFGYSLFSNPTQKTKTGTENRWRQLIATHLDHSNYLANQQQVLGFVVPFTSLSILCKNARPKPLCWAKPACYDFFFIQFSFAGPHTEHQWSYSYMLLLKEGR
jgi:hypothetical protein